MPERISQQLTAALRYRRSSTIDHNRVAFVIGRLEFFTVLVVFSRDFWR